jgi:hypothetical protein
MLVYDEFYVIYDKIETSWINRFFVVTSMYKIINYVLDKIDLTSSFNILLQAL